MLDQVCNRTLCVEKSFATLDDLPEYAFLIKFRKFHKFHSSHVIYVRYRFSEKYVTTFGMLLSSSQRRAGSEIVRAERGYNFPAPRAPFHLKWRLTRLLCLSKFRGCPSDEKKKYSLLCSFFHPPELNRTSFETNLSICFSYPRIPTIAGK